MVFQSFNLFPHLTVLENIILAPTKLSKSQKNEAIKKAVANLGIPFPDPILTLITLTGAAIPYLRICEEGLVNLKHGGTLPLFVD